MNSYDRLLWVDDRLISLYNFSQRLKFSLRGGRKRYGLAANAALKGRHESQRCFIVGNGPSIQKQDLSLLEKEHTFCVNHFYRHPDIKTVSPSYYAIVDPKLTTGEWPLSMLDDIQAQCPKAELLLSAKYQDSSPEIVERAKSFQHHWIYGNQILHEGFNCSTDLTQCIGGANVITMCLFAAIHMGFKEIYLMGIDCDGIFRDLVDQSSHFYEAEKENIGDNDPQLVVRHLRASLQGMRGWAAIARQFEGSSCEIINVTEGGLLNVFPRENYSEVLASKQQPYSLSC